MNLTADFSRIRIASSYTKLRTLASGLDPAVRELGIVSAWNPKRQMLTRDVNNARNEEMLEMAKHHGYGGIAMGGRFYGGLEHSYLFPHMDRPFTVALGKRFNQESVIYAHKTEDEHGNPAMQFHYILCDTGEDDAEPQTVVLSRDKAFKGSKGYSFMGGEKPRPSNKPGRTPPSPSRFVVPFFDRRYRHGPKQGEIIESPWVETKEQAED